VDVEAYMAERIPLIDAAIEARFATDSSGSFPAAGESGRWGAPIPESLSGAMRHLLFPGGKRLRPVFALAAAEAVGGSLQAALPLGVAVEMIHTYSLIHDDLPCMDDDALRRGRPTVHVVYGEATAVLAGDALLTEAFAVLAEPCESQREDQGRPTTDAPTDAQARIFAVGRLAAAAGASGLVGGQVDDLAFEADTPSSPAPNRYPQPPPTSSSESCQGTGQVRLASIHARKTAALFQASIVGGAAMAGGTQAELERLESFGRDVGIGVQIADDVLDADSEEAASILRIQGIDDARRGAEGLLDRALAQIEGWGEAAEPLRALARFAVRRKQ
jgi:geranylgeranyl diphosphate synthase type II